MFQVNCANCGRELNVALTTWERSSGEISARYCPKRCVGEVTPRIPPERKRFPKDEGRPLGETRSRLYRIDRELGETPVVTKGPKVKPKLRLAERIDEAELLAGLSEYRSMEISASTLAKRWDCQTQDIYQLDIDWKDKMRKKKRVIEKATKINHCDVSKQPLSSDPGPRPEVTGSDFVEKCDVVEPEPKGAIIELPKGSISEAEADALVAEEERWERELWGIAHKLRESGASQYVIQRETGLSRSRIRRRLWPSKPRDPTTLNGVDKMRQKLIDLSCRYERILKAVDVLLAAGDPKEPDQALVCAAAALLRSVGIRNA